ncbi:MAG: hypothetical protein M1816_008270 [Peltula sp. TS41687]|nr:MAG: hypothetical protein M1816_008270 [Peltula sp. TS41687]
MPGPHPPPPPPPTSSLIPPLLQPYLLPTAPRTSSKSNNTSNTLTLLTSTLRTTTNWLLSLIIHHHLSSSSLPSSSPPSSSSSSSFSGTATVVVLVSFLRDYEFWRNSLYRLGLDISRLPHKSDTAGGGVGGSRRFRFVDGLTGLFHPAGGGHGDARDERGGGKGKQEEEVRVRLSFTPGQGSTGIGMGMGMRGLEETLRREIHAARRAAASSTATASTTASNTEEIGGREAHGEENQVVLVIDGLDILLAAAAVETANVMELTRMITSLREATAGTQTPLETSHTALLLSLAHQARYIVSLRPLDTGFARDVGGVVRVGRGAGWYEDACVSWDGDDGGVEDQVEGDGDGEEVHEEQEGKGEGDGDGEGEWLFFVEGDGRGRVFERGGGG